MTHNVETQTPLPPPPPQPLQGTPLASCSALLFRAWCFSGPISHACKAGGRRGGIVWEGREGSYVGQEGVE